MLVFTDPTVPFARQRLLLGVLRVLDVAVLCLGLEVDPGSAGSPPGPALQANPPHFHMTQEKSAIFSKKRVFHETRVGLGVDGPHKAAGHLQNTPTTRLPLAASGSQSAL